MKTPIVCTVLTFSNEFYQYIKFSSNEESFWFKLVQKTNYRDTYNVYKEDCLLAIRYHPTSLNIENTNLSNILLRNQLFYLYFVTLNICLWCFTKL